MLTDVGLTKGQYNKLKGYLGRILPNYNEVLEVKKECYPDEIIITENSAEIKLQSLLDNTTMRLAKSVKSLDLQNTDKLVLISKWGMDGSSSQAEYKQRNEQGPSKDSSIFTSSIVILKPTLVKKE